MIAKANHAGKQLMMQAIEAAFAGALKEAHGLMGRLFERRADLLRRVVNGLDQQRDQETELLMAEVSKLKRSIEAGIERLRTKYGEAPAADASGIEDEQPRTTNNVADEEDEGDDEVNRYVAPGGCRWVRGVVEYSLNAPNSGRWVFAIPSYDLDDVMREIGRCLWLGYANKVTAASIFESCQLTPEQVEGGHSKYGVRHGEPTCEVRVVLVTPAGHEVCGTKNMLIPANESGRVMTDIELILGRWAKDKELSDLGTQEDVFEDDFANEVAAEVGAESEVTQ